MSQGILLESGTNELQIVVFTLGKELYGINVAKIESIVRATPVTTVPQSNPVVKGIIKHRDRVIPVIDMTKALNKPFEHKEDGLFIVICINNTDFAIQIDTVKEIKRLYWTDIQKPPQILSVDSSLVSGIVMDNEDMIVLVDLEKILSDINPSLVLKTPDTLGGLEGKKIIIVEDSPFLIKVVYDSLTKAGAEVERFENGRLALTYLEQCDVSTIHCVITDIEMPVMDGLTLTKNIKTHPKLKAIPVIIFSSIVNDALKHKGESVGADAQVTKPEIDKLVSVAQNIRNR